MDKTDFLIIGGGLASARAIRSYRESGGRGTVRLLSADTTPPYHRPPLSKAYLRGDADVEDTLVEGPAFYGDNGVRVDLGTTVRAVSPESRIVDTDRGRLAYGRLLIATGAAPRRLQVPGADLEGIHYLRSMADSTSIRRTAARSGAAVVVGGGFIGMEVAASLRRLGLRVTLVHRGTGLFDAVDAEPLQEQLGALFERHGVDLVLSDEIEAFHGHSRVEWISTTGGRRLEADLAVIGIGVSPVVAFLEGSGITTGDGISVDARYQTEAEGVYAAGDVAEFPDPIVGRRRRVEHWSNADFQGTEVGRMIAGGAPHAPRVSSFFTEVFGTTIRVFGDTTGHESLSWHGSLEAGAAVGLFGGADGRLVAAVTTGQPGAVDRRLGEWIGAGALLDSVQERMAGEVASQAA